ncbi:MAG: oxidoreductase [Candidatus Eisenbacteria bacterium]|nr:oxidoreductase [Candidatus Eisenbacteria bacterium]
MSKLKIALYWAASCGGCEIAVLDIKEKILDVAAACDILFWPVALDFKYKDVEAMPDKHIDVCFFNGAIRTSENEHMAKLMRQKSKILIAYGSCANEGCIPGLANLYSRQSLLDRVYSETPSTDNPNGTRPQLKVKVPEGELTLPEFYDRVKTLAQTVDVDYFVPGCPPVADKTWAALEAIVTGNLPPKGSVVGAGDKTCCDECDRKREEKKIKKFYRFWEIIPEEEKCLLEQGIICAGPATRSGCGTVCVNKGKMPCRGCYGPPPGVIDQGAKLLSALGSIVDSNDPDEIQKIVGEIVDPAGYLYRFGLVNSLLGQARTK